VVSPLGRKLRIANHLDHTGSRDTTERISAGPDRPLARTGGAKGADGGARREADDGLHQRDRQAEAARRRPA
jgi:hypothetical protein